MSPALYSNRGQGAWGSPPPPQEPPTEIILSGNGHPSGGGPSKHGVGTGHSQRQVQGGVLPTVGGGGSGTGGAGGGGGTGLGGSRGSSNSLGLGGGGRPSVGLPTIIRSAVEALIAADMQGVAAVTTVAVEARSEADDRGRGLSLIMRSHLRHICGVAGDDDVPSIWREM